MPIREAGPHGRGKARLRRNQIHGRLLAAFGSAGHWPCPLRGVPTLSAWVGNAPCKRPANHSKPQISASRDRRTPPGPKAPFSGQKEAGRDEEITTKAGRFVGLLVGMLAGAAAWGQPGSGRSAQRHPLPVDGQRHPRHPSPRGEGATWNEFEPDEFHLWDPASGASTLAAAPGYNVFCTGHALLADGRVLVSGGSLGTNRGMPNASIYDPTLDTWTRLPDMNDGRWYPTNTPLPNGDMLVTAGTVNQRRLGEPGCRRCGRPRSGPGAT